MRIYDRCNQDTSIRFLDYVFEKLPFRVDVIQTDNGAEFQSRFHYHVLDAASVTSTADPQHRDSTARLNALTALTKKSSTGCSTA